MSLLALAATLVTTSCAAFPEVSAVPQSTVRIHAGSDVVLPGTLRFADRMGTAHVAPLPAPLSLDEARRLTAPEAGDVGYAPEAQALVVFLHDRRGTGGEELLAVGHVTSGLDDLAGCVQDCLVALVPTATD